MGNRPSKIKGYFTRGERALWCTSVLLIILSFVIFGGQGWLTLCASLIGVTSLLFAAKGNPAAMALMIIFSVIYSVISYRFAYYGEMITYAGMTLPMSVYSLIVWLRHPYAGQRSEVEVRRRLSTREWLLMAVLTAAVTAVFGYLLAALGTANLLPGTVSVATSFAAVYLTGRRSPYYAIAYAMNDVVLIVLWVMASVRDAAYLSVVVCFAVFLVNDIYGFISWQKMQRRQSADRS